MDTKEGMTDDRQTEGPHLGGDRFGGHGTQLPGPKGLDPGGLRIFGAGQGGRLWPWGGPSGQKAPGAGRGYAGGGLCRRGEELRRGGIVLAHPLPGARRTRRWARDLLDWDLTQTVEDLESAQALSRVALAAGKRLRGPPEGGHWYGTAGVSLGGWRERFRPGEDDRPVRPAWLEVEGMFTHFAAADEDETYTAAQLRRFLEAKKALEDRGLHFAIYHCGASAAVLHYGQSHMDMIRPGIALYGFPPAPGIEAPGLIPVMTLKSRWPPSGQCLPEAPSAMAVPPCWSGIPG